ncbi:MAG: aminotransferase class I/II-fold pyridoxal phosphate-dependent enzyme, partial [Desulfuromonadales bacterium]|nr:aminotransferase class I/II-fold pyridoxal phosphate-dependent enzyme [Desulfuromonadales bacterium]
AGMRLGLAIGPVAVIEALDKIRDHYNIDRLAQVAATAALKDQTYLRHCVEKICATREWFSAALRELSYLVIASQGNFVFVLPPDRDSWRVYDHLFKRKILVRFIADGLRISIGSRQQMEVCLAALKEISQEPIRINGK